MRIRQQVIDYRNTHRDSRVILSVVLGEFDRKEKECGRTSKEITDSEAINIIKKLIESNKLVNSKESLQENELLEQFLPKQLSELKIKDIIEECDFKSIKDCMTFFKDQYSGLYDGKIVSKLFNQK